MSGNGPRIVLFTVEETDLVPRLLSATLDRWGDSIVCAYVSRSLFGPRFLRNHARFLLANRYPFCIRPDDLARFAMAGLRRHLSSSRSLRDQLRAQGVRAHHAREIRSADTRRALAALSPDLFLFCPFDQIAGARFLAVPRLGTYNVHLGPLPEHRGGLSAFWVLRNGEAEAGAAVHRVTPELDRGDVVAEVRFPVRKTSMRELMIETCERASPVVADSIGRIVAGDWDPVPTAGRPEGYQLLPTSEDFRAFYRRGCRLI